MSESAAKVLEGAAQKYASEAIRFDSQGARGMAIKNYQNAIQTLVQLAQLYPDYKLNGMYLQRAQLYQERIKALQAAHGIEPPPEDESSGFTFQPPRRASSSASAPQPPSANDDKNGPQVVQQLKSNYNDLIMKEKPNVKWDEVVGLEDAKKALRESIIFPVQRPDLFPLGWPRGMLMYGPPGCGKTLLAAATASEIESYFITVDAASIMSKWLGEGEKNVAKLFNSARKLLEKEAEIRHSVHRRAGFDPGIKNQRSRRRSESQKPVPERNGRNRRQGKEPSPVHYRRDQQALGAGLAVPQKVPEENLRTTSRH